MTPWSPLPSGQATLLSPFSKELKLRGMNPLVQGHTGSAAQQGFQWGVPVCCDGTEASACRHLHQQSLC